MNLNKLMKQAQKMQEQMAKTQAELESKTVEVSAGGGKVKVTANAIRDEQINRRAQYTGAAIMTNRE